MPDPEGLLLVAKTLSDPGASRASDASLRRAVSTAYYALFHKVLRAAAERFMGSNKERSAGYRVLYRSFEHRHMREQCQALDVGVLSSKLQRQLRRRSVSADMREFASGFAALQEARHMADYDPAIEFLSSDALSLVAAADNAMAAFDRADPDEKADILALLMVRTQA